MRLTKNFKLEEFIRSQTASREGIDNTPTSEEIENITYGCEKVMEPVRNFIGAMIYLTSGFRCKKLNKRIGGSRKSQHCFGEAADCHAVGLTPRQFARRIIDSGVVFDQLIVEFDRWTHVSWTRKKQPRMKLLYAYKDGRKTKYREMRYEELI